MTRSGLAERVAQKAKTSGLKAESVVEAVFDCMKSAFQRGERVEVRGLGTFKVRSTCHSTRPAAACIRILTR